MAMRRYPFEEMERMMEQMRHTMMEGWGERSSPWGEKRSDINLSLDRDDEGYVVLADMPGFEKEAIDLRFDDETLSIEASHETSTEDDTTTRRHTRHVHEQLYVPGEVISDEISATYRNGVLEVHLPTHEEVGDDESRIDID